MARLAQPSINEFDDPEDREAYEAVINRRARMGMVGEATPALGAPDAGEYFGALLNSPTMCKIAARMGTFIRTAGERPGTYSHADREFVDQVLSTDWRTNVVQLLHVPDGVAAGVRLEAVRALRSGDESALTADEQLLARYIRQTVSGTVDQETFDQMRERLGTRGLVEYSGFILWLQWIIRMMQLLGVDDPPEEKIDELIKGLSDGSIPLPNYRERLG